MLCSSTYYAFKHGSLNLPIINEVDPEDCSSTECHGLCFRFACTWWLVQVACLKVLHITVIPVSCSTLRLVYFQPHENQDEESRNQQQLLQIYENLHLDIHTSSSLLFHTQVYHPLHCRRWHQWGRMRSATPGESCVTDVKQLIKGTEKLIHCTTI